MRHQKILDHAHLFHGGLHLRIRHGSFSHLIADNIHPLFHGKQRRKSTAQDIRNRHACFQHRMLIQISYLDIACPLNLARIRQELSRNHTHKSRLALSVGADHADVFALEQSERNIRKNLPVAKSVGQVFYIQYTHALAPSLIIWEYENRRRHE